MSILALVLFAWAVACWFSGPFDIPFLGLVFFHVDPIAPFTAALIAAVGALSLWFLRRGKRDLKRIIAWLRENRLQTIHTTCCQRIGGKASRVEG